MFCNGDYQVNDGDGSLYPYLLLPALESKHGLRHPPTDGNIGTVALQPSLPWRELGRVLCRRPLLSTVCIHVLLSTAIPHDVAALRLCAILACKSPGPLA